VIFVADLHNVGNQLQQPQAAYAAATNHLSQRRGNLIRRAEQLRCLMPNNDKTEIAIILDRSGSMETIRKDMEGGFKALRPSPRSRSGTTRWKTTRGPRP